MTSRQAYAFTHPVADPRTLLDDVDLWAVDTRRDGNHLRSALAVDR